MVDVPRLAVIVPSHAGLEPSLKVFANLVHRASVKLNCPLAFALTRPPHNPRDGITQSLLEFELWLVPVSLPPFACRLGCFLSADCKIPPIARNNCGPLDPHFMLKKLANLLLPRLGLPLLWRFALSLKPLGPKPLP